jgi:hypothetical protein
MDSSLWIPLSGLDELTIDPGSAWNSGLVSMPTCPKVEDCLCSFCCPCCAFSEEYFYWKRLELAKKNSVAMPMPSCSSKFCDCLPCCGYICLSSCIPFPCLFNCILRGEYTQSNGIESSCCGNFLATFICCCCAHAQVDHMPPPLRARPPRPPRARSSRQPH